MAAAQGQSGRAESLGIPRPISSAAAWSSSAGGGRCCCRLSGGTRGRGAELHVLVDAVDQMAAGGPRLDMSIYDKATNPYHRSGLEGSEVLLPAVGTLTQRAAPFILQPKRKIMTTLLPCCCWLLPACVTCEKCWMIICSRVTSTCTYST